MTKPLKDLTFKDNFMFSAVMLDSENCKAVLECILGIPIEHVNVEREKSIVYHPEYRGVRLDVYAKDARNTRFNVEMQIEPCDYPHRARYYHASMDMDLLTAGMNYRELPDCFVIFICDHDPFGYGKYRYTLKHHFAEVSKRSYDDGTYTIFLNTHGTNDEEEPAQLVSFLRYVATGVVDVQQDMSDTDTLVRKIHNAVENIKAERGTEERYMMFEEMRQELHEKGMAEGLAKGLAKGKLEGMTDMVLTLAQRLGNPSEDIQDKIRSCKSEEILKMLQSAAADCKSVKEFEQKAATILA